MCGIFSLINYHKFDKRIVSNFNKGRYRGPEFSTLKIYNNIFLGFHRLAINGLNEQANQPFYIDDIVIVCNGEIYNFKELAEDNNIELITGSDCEIIIHLYKLYGIEYTLNILDGVFAFILYDSKINTVFACRDPYGVRPLYYYYYNNKMAFASELKTIYNLSEIKQNINNFCPGSYMAICNNEIIQYNYKKYTSFPCNNIIYEKSYNYPNDIYKNIMYYITAAVKKRVVGTCERPIACLLSGGLDSSLIAALVNKHYSSENKLETYSIGLPGSEDLKYAAIVAKHLNTNHHEIIVTEDDFFNAIPEVIKTIESYDTTTVRASVGNYLIGKYIKENSNAKVIFNGDGADELMGGYLYFKKAPNLYEFDKECKRLLDDIFMFDVLRSDKCISSHGLEPRTPFLDRKWVEYYLSLDKNLRYITTINNCEKYLIRKAFDMLEPDLLPKEILWRTKEAFSDGVSSLNKAWFQIIQEKIERLYIKENTLKKNLNDTLTLYKNLRISNNIPETYEQAYYRYLYNKHYMNTDHLIAYYWMPKYVNAKDSSARTLNIYDENNSNKLK